ncbi:MAG: hypothetical protein R2795_15760 [Saprospiraceae bacterium]
MAQMVTTENGAFSFELALGGDYSLTPYLNAQLLNGVTAFDLSIDEQAHLECAAIEQPIQVDCGGRKSLRNGHDTGYDPVAKVDLEHRYRVCEQHKLEIYPGLCVPNTSEPMVRGVLWVDRFVNDLAGDVMDADFVGVKIGDVNGSAQANALSGDDRTLNGQFNFNVATESLKAGNVYTVSFTGTEMASVGKGSKALWY